VKSYKRKKFSTVDLLVLTSLGHLILNELFSTKTSYLNEEVNLTELSPLVFPGSEEVCEKINSKRSWVRYAVQENFKTLG